jgi:hypothetical protein
MRYLIAFKPGAAALVPIVVSLSCRTAQPNSPTAAAQADFGHLERLVGRWRCPVAEAKTVELAYRLVSSGSALVETFTNALRQGDADHLSSGWFSSPGHALLRAGKPAAA